VDEGSIAVYVEGDRLKWKKTCLQIDLLASSHETRHVEHVRAGDRASRSPSRIRVKLEVLSNVCRREDDDSHFAHGIPVDLVA
jgi:hypothetical protein